MHALEARVRLMFGRAIVRLVDDARLAQELQIDLLEDESQDAVEHLQPYGFAAHPHSGAEAVVGCVGGLRSHAIVIAVADRRYRLRNLEQGEVGIYDDLGNIVVLKRGKIEITAQSKIEMTAPDGLKIIADTEIQGDITITGDVSIDGAVTTTGDVTADGITLKHHKHSGVQAGAAQTGEPV